MIEAIKNLSKENENLIENKNEQSRKDNKELRTEILNLRDENLALRT